MIDILYLTFLLINIGTFIYVMAQLEDRKGWIWRLPVFLVFGFVVAFILIADYIDPPKP